MPDRYTVKNLTEVEDSAEKHGFGETQEARFANGELETESTGISHHRVKPGKRQGFGHKHEETEEVYLVISGSGRIKLDDEVVEISALDAIRIAPDVARSVEAGDDGIEYVAVSRLNLDDRGEVIQEFWDDSAR